ncbi:hypothetical protein Tco_0740818 [Tanacetum coccineum]
MARMVANVFEERIPDLLYETLKNILPKLIKDSVKQSLQKFDKRMKKTLKATVPNLILKLLNKEFNALNTLESRSFEGYHGHQCQANFKQGGKELQSDISSCGAQEQSCQIKVSSIIYMMAAKGEKDTAREGPLTIKEAKAQMEEIKRLAELKAEKRRKLRRDEEANDT